MSEELDPKQHPADIADALQHMELEDAVAQLRTLPAETASEVLTELDEGIAADITGELTSEELGQLLDELPHDEAADIAAELTPEQQEEVLSQLDPPDSVRVSNLMKYPEDSAGGIMSDEFIALPANITVAEGLKIIHGMGEDEFPGAAYVYTVDEQNKLIGLVSVRDLVFRKPTRLLREVMNPEVKLINAKTDQEEVARLFTQYHFLALPVVDDSGRLVGIVDSDQVLDVIQEEATEDMQKMVGVSGEESAFTPWKRALGMRTPWLYINLITAFAAAAVIAIFEETLAQWTVLAVFLPIIAGQGGNSGMQALTVTIRSMALGELEGDTARKVIVKEVVMGVLNGILFGVTVGLIGFLWKGSVLLGVIVFFAMLLNMVAASTAGVLIPLALRTFKIDPALSSSIFLTTVTDVAGFFFFLGLAALLIPLFG